LIGLEQINKKPSPERNSVKQDKESIVPLSRLERKLKQKKQNPISEYMLV
jgi:hypothetical protein